MKTKQLLNNQWITEEIKEETKKISGNIWQQKHDDTQPLGYSKNNSKREVYRFLILSHDTRKISNNQPDLISKSTRERLQKEEQGKLKVNKRNEIIKIRAEINKIERKKKNNSGEQ